MSAFVQKFVQAILFSAFISVALAVEPEQISQPRYDDHGVHYGLPGWETKMDYVGNSAELPQPGSFLHISLKHPQYSSMKMTYAGEEYDEVTVTSSGRVYLGHLPDDYDVSEEARGRVPYFDPKIRPMQPVLGMSGIRIRWKDFFPETGYAVLEIGPFYIEGFSYQISYQVFLYTDGEIQFQMWVNWESIAAYTFFGQYEHSLLDQLFHRNIVNPVLYNGGHLLASDYKTMTRSTVEPILHNGQLRPGWIAKSFDDKKVLLNQGVDGVEVYFGTENAAGGLFAYDHSREHPIVGSFNYVTVDAHSLSYGDGRTDKNAVEVFFWYFGKDRGDFIANAHDANYPYFRDGIELLQTYPVVAEVSLISNNGWTYRKVDAGDSIPYAWKFSSSSNYSVIWPIAYMKSWHASGVGKWELDKHKAIAFKFQTLDLARNRAIVIKNVKYGLRQPRSVQFLRPQTHTLSFESDGLAHMKGIDFNGKLPRDFVDGTSLSARIVPAPGDTIEEVRLNGTPFYKLDGSVDPNPYVQLQGDGTVELNIPEFKFDIHVTATSKKCLTRVLPAVNPSYVKAEVFLDPSNASRKLETYSVKDGLGRVVQTQTSLGNGVFNVSSTYLDDFGNVEYAPLSYLSLKNSFAYEDMFCKQCIAKSSAYHNGSDDLDKQEAFGVPYAKEDYHYGENNGVTKDVSGVAMASQVRGMTPSMQWTIPLKTSSHTNFLSEKQLDEKVLTDKYASAKRAIVNDKSSVEDWTEYSYKLVVNRSAEGVFTQQIFDANGNILYAWAKSGEQTVISRTHYNSDNQIEYTDISVDGESFGLATSYTYDAAGRIKTVSTPDKGTVETVYDPDDNIRFTRDARQLMLANKNNCNGNYFSTIEYNEKGKVIKTGEVHCGHSFTDSATAVPDDELYILSEMFYGKPTLGELLSTHVTTDSDLLQDILDSMDGVLPNDVGAVASYDGSRVRSDAAIRANSLKMSSYNRLGQKVKQWTVYGLDGAPAVQVSFTYNVSGELSATETAEWKNGTWNTISSLAYFYDDMGRLKSVLESGDSLMRVDRTVAGTISKKAYFDKGDHVYDMTYARDVYGRTTRISYRDASGKILYSDTVTYPSVVAGRVATAHHAWDGFGSDETYSYDPQGRLTGYSTNNSRIGEGHYRYDELGRLTFKKEGDTTISYTYTNTLFRPMMMNVNNSADTAYFVYDPSGNVWIDRNSKNSYTINALGLPSRVRLFSEDPVNSTYDEVQSDVNLAGQIGFTDMAYDEGGQRIWTKFVVGAPAYETKVTYPGIGEYSYYGPVHSSNLQLTRVDLLGGGYRTGLNGEALFPVKDLQGSVRGYVNKTGLKSAFGYRPYGTTVDLAHYASESDERWQGKKFDGEHDKYYFGARYYDPFFGMWISPDPAGQFANPYSYGGDPLNYIDPTGMWALGLGLVVGYDKSHGWSFGLGAAAEIGDIGINASFSFNQDGSKSLSLSANASIPVFNTGLWLNAGLGFNLNSYTGASFSRSAGVCYGASTAACAGVEVGQGFSWDRSGGFNGMTVYAEAYVTYAGVRTSVGYEHGFFGAEGRGLYAGISGYGLHAQVAQNGGFSWGVKESIYLHAGKIGEVSEDGKSRNVGLEIWIPTLGEYGHFGLGKTYDVSPAGLQKKQREEITKLLLGVDDELLARLNAEWDSDALGGKLSHTSVVRLNKWLVNNGFERVDRPNLLHGKNTQKLTWRHKGSSEYGNLEIIMPTCIAKNHPEWSGAYSSYNYGNNMISHFFIDVLW